MPQRSRLRTAGSASTRGPSWRRRRLLRNRSGHTGGPRSDEGGRGDPAGHVARFEPRADKPRSETAPLATHGATLQPRGPAAPSVTVIRAAFLSTSARIGPAAPRRDLLGRSRRQRHFGDGPSPRFHDQDLPPSTLRRGPPHHDAIAFRPRPSPNRRLAAALDAPKGRSRTIRSRSASARRSRYARGQHIVHTTSRATRPRDRRPANACEMYYIIRSTEPRRRSPPRRGSPLRGSAP